MRHSELRAIVRVEPLLPVCSIDAVWMAPR